MKYNPGDELLIISDDHFNGRIGKFVEYSDVVSDDVFVEFDEFLVERCINFKYEDLFSSKEVVHVKMATIT